jgi:LysR family transcriptional regulator, low CO2-responsive transcriptional regulator
MNLNQLRIFYESAKLENFSKAAERLYITQPAVSAQIKQLEDFFDVKLFNTIGRRVHLTDAGKVLLETAHKIFELEREAEAAMQDIRELKRGALHIAVTKDYAPYVIPRYVSRFHALHPAISIHLSEGSSAEIIEDLAAYKHELAIVGGTNCPKWLVRKTFRAEELLLVAASNHPVAAREAITVKELAELPLILREEGSTLRTLVMDMFRERNLSPNIAYEASNLEFIKKLGIRGEGVHFVSRKGVEAELASGVLKEIRVEGVQLIMDTSVVYMKHLKLSKIANAFLEMLFE